MSGKKGIPKKSRPILKIILVGASGVGKTCLISSYFRQSFDFQSTPTVAPAYSCSDIRRNDGIVVSLQIWDTAGQERYHSIGKLFFRDSDVAFVCCEIGDQVSSEEVPIWVKQVRDEVPMCKLFLVLTKADLHNEPELSRIKKMMEEKFKDLGFLGVFVTSSFSRTGVQEIFNYTAEQCIKADDFCPNVTEKPKANDRSCC